MALDDDVSGHLLQLRVALDDDVSGHLLQLRVALDDLAFLGTKFRLRTAVQREVASPDPDQGHNEAEVEHCCRE